ncbi:MAG: PIG-L family deacetylase [Calditrichaeota bacterium]|nr:PIG-L family deacetylase [Calditrichota bacterium]
MKKIVLALLLVNSLNLFAQHNVKYNSEEIQLALNKLNVLGSVLYIAAHPDDENQAFLSYMAKGRLYRTAYMSLTRGDGGQNLLGSEKGALLGVIRTQELLAARRIDGAQQFFSRAIDFGYSKSVKETLHKWDRDKILADIVKVIRIFKPDVIVTRFNENNGGHGHHLSSAVLAKEAFFAAGDPNRFPEQLEELDVWQPKRIYWNSWRNPEQKPGTPPLLELNFGAYNPLLGLSYQEIASKSRTMHKTQGFGSTPYRGDATNNFEYTAGDTAYHDLFDGIETSWHRVPESTLIEKAIQEILIRYDHQNPEASLPLLVRLYNMLEKQTQTFWINEKKNEVKELIRMCSGLWLEANAQTAAVTPGENVTIRLNSLNRSDYDLSLRKVSVAYSSDSLFNEPLLNNKSFAFSKEIRIPDTAAYSQPYWLEKPASETMFNVSDKEFKGAPQSLPAVSAVFGIQMGKTYLEYSVPVEYQWNDPTAGEQYKPFSIEPAIGISLPEESYVFAGQDEHEISVTLHANRDHISGTLRPELPENWEIRPASAEFNFSRKGEEFVCHFKVKPLAAAQNGFITFFADADGKIYSDEIIRLNYPHIPEQVVLKPARAHLVKPDIIVPEKRVAYIMGSGDEIPQALEQIGIKVDLISDDQLASVDYNVYDTVICGVRAFNTRENLGILQSRIMDYVAQGGTWIVQHNTRFGIQVDRIGPYPFVSHGRDRISEEDADIEILDPNHPVFNYPNKITQSDFKGWIQERATYMAESWEGKLYPLLSGHDEGESAKLGGLLYAPYGKGVFIFTALSWFRQLPAGVPGAYRLFVNLICAGDKTNN